MEAVSHWVLGYASRRLNRDPDVVGDFYVHVYDKVPRFLADYEQREDLATPFTGFFALCLRHEFMNFIRNRRRATFQEQVFSEMAAPVSMLRAGFGFYGDHPRLGPAAGPSHQIPTHVSPERVNSWIYRQIDELPMRLRLPVKLVHGLDPDAGELRELIRLTGGPGPASRWLFEFHRRREALSLRLGRLADRAAHLSVLIDSFDRRSDLTGDPRTYARWKNRLARALRGPHPLFSLKELGQLFGKNKTTMMRRLDRAGQLLRAREQEEAIA